MSRSADDEPFHYSPLALIECGILRADARLVPLHRILTLFTELLDAVTLTSLAQAAVKGSVRLFDRVLLRLASDASIDRAQVDFWFARAMQAALEKDDLAMIQHIHALHPEPRLIQGLPAQWIMENRADRACCSPGVRNYCPACVSKSLRSISDRDAIRIVAWGFLQQHVGAPQKCPALVQWLADHNLLSQERARGLLLTALHQGRSENAMVLLDIVEAPMPRATAIECLLHASFAGFEEVIDKLIALGHCNDFRDKFEVAPVASKRLVQWRAELMNEKIGKSTWTVAGVCVETASLRCNLDALQWLFHERDLGPNARLLAHETEDETKLLEVCQWMVRGGLELPTSLMDAAAGRGFLDVVKWLDENSAAGCTTAAMDKAAANGHLKVVEWLHENRHEGCTTNAMPEAAGNGHLHVVQWLSAHRHDHELDARRAMEYAAAHGHLDIVMWLARGYPSTACTRRMRSFVFEGSGRDYSPICIDVLRWIDAQPTNECARCQRGNHELSGAMVCAAERGDLEVCNYLYETHREKTDPVESAGHAAQNGHLGTLQRIYATFGVAPVREQDAEDAVTWNDDWSEYVVEEATAFGHEHILGWVHTVKTTDS